MRQFRFTAILVVLFACFQLSASTFDVKEADITVTVGKNAVHTIEENYIFYYNTPAHGFLRDIPTDYSEWKVRARVSNVMCSDKCSVEREGAYVTLRIGDEDTYVNGYKEYAISYNYDLGADYNEGYDEFYLNLIGSSWESSFENVKFTVIIPYAGDDMKIYLTDGSYGSQSFSGSAEAYVDGEYTYLIGTVAHLDPGQALTVRIELPDSWYEGAREIKDNRARFSVIMSAVSVALVLIAFAFWSKYGKDKRLIITAQYDAPEGFTPLAVGYVADGTVDDKDITSMIYYWADKGYLRIEEPKKNRFEFVRTIQELPQDCPSYERRLFRAFFRKADSEGRVTLPGLQKGNFAQSMMDARSDVKSYFSVDRDLADTKSQICQGVFTLVTFLPGILSIFAVSQYEFVSDQLFILGFGAFLTPVIMLLLFSTLLKKWYLRKSNLGMEILIAVFTVAMILIRYVSTTLVYEDCPLYMPVISVLSTVLLALLSSIMIRRSKYGQKILEEILGYREFIDKVETDKLKIMIEKDPDLYYRVLSYAIVFGLENKWAKKFSSLSIADPTWYTGVSPVDVMLYSAMSSRMNNAIRMNAIPPAQARSGGLPRIGGGGFGSSGFSGGGFGGGGGHAW